MNDLIVIEDLLDVNTLLLYLPLSVFFIGGVSYLAGYLKLNRNIKTNYTRKLFHISIFTFAGIIGLFGSFEGVLIYGGISALFIFYVLFRGDGNIFYEGIAREGDSPNRSLYIILPLIATAVGGLLGRFMFESIAVIGYFVVGFGDAVGEPIGVRFGKHQYQVPSLSKNKFRRSVEGSTAVFLVATVSALAIILYVLEYTMLEAMIGALVIGIIACVVEAVSPHGLDNFTVQFLPLIGANFVFNFI